MTIATAITRLLVGGAAASIIYFGANAALPDGKQQPIEPGFANPEHVELYKPKNGMGNVELFLKYSNGAETITLPVMKSNNGILVGDTDYYWSTIGAEARARLAEEGWKDLDAAAKSRIVEGSWNAIDSGLKTELVQQEWNSLEATIKSDLVYESWSEILTDTKKSILKSELDKMVETYGE